MCDRVRAMSCKIDVIICIIRNWQWVYYGFNSLMTILDEPKLRHCVYEFSCRGIHRNELTNATHTYAYKQQSYARIYTLTLKAHAFYIIIQYTFHRFYAPRIILDLFLHFLNVQKNLITHSCSWQTGEYLRSILKFQKILSKLCV